MVQTVISYGCECGNRDSINIAYNNGDNISFFALTVLLQLLLLSSV